MASYQQPCRACGTLIDRASRFCPKCGSRAPFVDLCPACLNEMSKGDAVCSSCGRPLQIACPSCKGNTFVGDACECCGISLLITCQNPRCKQMQFFENTHCTACGKKLKKTGIYDLGGKRK